MHTSPGVGLSPAILIRKLAKNLLYFRAVSFL